MKRFFTYASLVVGLLLIAALIVPPVVAQSKSVVMPRRDADITILPNGDVQFVETWEVQFKGGPFHSAFRAIPLNNVDEITDWSIAEGEQVYRSGHEEPYSYETSTADNKVTTRWYFPETSDQTRKFIVRYTLKGAIRKDTDGDRFTWWFIEGDRQYPINAARVVLHLPQAFGPSQLKYDAYQSPKPGEKPGTLLSDGKSIEFTGGPFPEGTAWELRVLLPRGVVARYKSSVVLRPEVDMAILENGDVQVVETWEMQFINGPLTSASRTMPQWNKVDAITDWSVAEEEHVYQPGHGDPYSFETSTSSGKVTTRWYFPGVRDQTRAFTVRYTLKGALWIDPAGDRFHWTLFEYASPITSTRMLLHLPRRFEVEELKFTTYSNHRLLDGQTIEFAFSGSGSEFDVQFPHGTVTAQPPAWQKAEAQSSNALRLMLIAIVVCGIVTVTAGIWLRRLTQRQGVKPAKLVVAIAVLAPSAVCTAISLPAVAGGTLVSTMSREFLILVFAGWTIPALLVLLIGYGRGGAGAGGWSGGGDFGGGGGYDGGGGGGDSGGSSGFD